MQDRRFPRLLCALMIATTPFGALLAAPAAAFPNAAVFDGTLLSNPFNETFDLEVAYSPAGEGAAAWVEQNGSEYTLWTARHDFANGWTTPSLLQASAMQIGELDLAMRGTGAATLAWVVRTTPTSIWYADVPAAAPPGPAVLLRNVSTSYYGPLDLAVGAPGVAFIVWTEADGGSAGWGAVVHPSLGVDGPERFDGGSAGVNYHSILADPTTGGATAVWCDTSGPTVNITTASYFPGSGWSPPTAAVPDAAGSCYFMAAGVDGAGNITVLLTSPSTPGEVVAFRQAPNEPWSGAEPVGTTQVGEDLQGVALEVNPDGSMLAVWRTRNIVRGQHILEASAWAAGDGWTTHRLVNNVTTLPGFGIALAEGRGGLVVFSPSVNSTDYLNAAQYTRESSCSGWDTLTSPSIRGLGTNNLEVAVASDGRGQYLYQFHNGVATVIMAGVVAMATPPPPEITSPQNGVLVADPVASLSGRAWPNALIEVRGATYRADPAGYFAVALPLVDGPNLVDLHFTHEGDAWQPCTASASIVIYYDERFAATQQELDRVADELAGTKAQLQAAYGELNLTNGDLDAALADLAALEAALNDTADELSRIKVQFPWLEANAAAAQANVTLLKGEITAIEADYAAAQQALDEATAEILLLRAQQNQTTTVLRESTDTNAALSGQVATLSMVAFIALLAAVAGIGLSLVQARRGGEGGGSGGALRANEPRPATQGAEPASKGGPDKQEPPGPAGHGG